MKFAAFSDIHYAEYSTGVTVSDIAGVEKEFTDFCLEKKVDFCVFAGDRYLSHHPDDEARIHSDLEQRYRNDCGIVTFALIGNHDVWAKSLQAGHSNKHLTVVWHDVLPNVVVMDEVRTYRHELVPGVAIHALPACINWPQDLSCFDLKADEFNLLVFHDMLEGAIIDHSSGYKSVNGRKIDLIDNEAIHLVLGGDVHIPQRLPFKYTQGGYIGSAIQQSRRDRGNARGWLYCEADDMSWLTEKFPIDVKMSFEESSAPRFVDVTWDLTAGGPPTAEEIEANVSSTYDDTCEGNIVDVILIGTREHLDLVSETWHLEMQAAVRSKKFNVLRKPKDMRIVQISPVSRSTSPVEDLDAYLQSGRASLGGLDPDRLLQKATPILTRLVEHG